jgi:hypothetical protein
MYIYIYIYIHTYIYIYIHIHTYTHIHTYIPSLLRAAIPTHVDARACAGPQVCAHTRARLGGRRRAQRPAPHRRPAEHVPPAVARRPGRKGGAYIVPRDDRRSVPRADVRVECRRIVERLRAEPPAVHADGTRSHASAWMRGRPIAHANTRARARTQHVRACVRRARIGDPFVGVARRACMHHIST